MPINSRKDKHSLLHAYNGVLCFNENELHTSTHNNMPESHEHNSDLKNTNTKEYLCVSLFRQGIKPDNINLCSAKVVVTLRQKGELPFLSKFTSVSGKV